MKLSRLCPQLPRSRRHRARSARCGFVDQRSPQAVDRAAVHSLCTGLSTGDPQVGARCPQRSPLSPHACPLFGNTTCVLTASSERRHIEVPQGPVGKTAKAGDGSGENSPHPVHGVCRTFRSPQRPLVVHCSGPQGPWIKSPG
ncbi:hypothetical protein DKG34_14650 [Streptomyces sp. NWU49]|nr:hypothetical protein DKG34_14650 [Streptomyces sp. NWU49]